MRFVKIQAILSTVTNLGCIRKRIFNGTGFSKNIKKHFFDNAFVFRVIFFTISRSFHNVWFEKCSDPFKNVRFVGIVYSSVSRPRF